MIGHLEMVGRACGGRKSSTWVQVSHIKPPMHVNFGQVGVHPQVGEIPDQFVPLGELLSERLKEQSILQVSLRKLPQVVHLRGVFRQLDESSRDLLF